MYIWSVFLWYRWSYSRLNLQKNELDTLRTNCFHLSDEITSLYLKAQWKSDMPVIFFSFSINVTLQKKPYQLTAHHKGRTVSLTAHTNSINNCRRQCFTYMAYRQIFMSKIFVNMHVHLFNHMHTDTYTLTNTHAYKWSMQEHLI
jgi:hypothetical protein